MHLHDENLQKMKEMGLDEVKSQRALRLKHNNLGDAIEMVFSGGADVSPVIAPQQPPSTPVAEATALSTNDNELVELSVGSSKTNTEPWIQVGRNGKRIENAVPSGGVSNVMDLSEDGQSQHVTNFGPAAGTVSTASHALLDLQQDAQRPADQDEELRKAIEASIASERERHAKKREREVEDMVIDLTGGTGGAGSSSEERQRIEEEQLSRVIEASLRDSNPQHKQQPASLHWDDNPYVRRREPGFPAGLKNVGNTCYFNSLIQVYFHIAALRDAILGFSCDVAVRASNDGHGAQSQAVGDIDAAGRAVGSGGTARSRVVAPSSKAASGPSQNGDSEGFAAGEVPVTSKGSASVHRVAVGDEQAVSVAEETIPPLYKMMDELRKLFAFLLGTPQRSVDPTRFVHSVVDENGKVVSIGEQQDASEFNMLMIERIEEAMDRYMSQQPARLAKKQRPDADTVGQAGGRGLVFSAQDDGKLDMEDEHPALGSQQSAGSTTMVDACIDAEPLASTVSPAGSVAGEVGGGVEAHMDDQDMGAGGASVARAARAGAKSNEGLVRQLFYSEYTSHYTASDEQGNPVVKDIRGSAPQLIVTVVPSAAKGAAHTNGEAPGISKGSRDGADEGSGDVQDAKMPETTVKATGAKNDDAAKEQPGPSVGMKLQLGAQAALPLDLHAALDAALYGHVDFTTDSGHRSLAQQATFFDALPPYLIVHVQRVTYDTEAKEARKVARCLEFSKELNMGRYLSCHRRDTVHLRERLVGLRAQHETYVRQLANLKDYRGIGMGVDALLGLAGSRLEERTVGGGWSGGVEGRGGDGGVLVVDEPAGLAAAIQTLQRCSELEKEEIRRVEVAKKQTEADMDALFAAVEQDPTQRYRIKAVLVHEGSAATAGHYYVFVHDPADDTWRRFSDVSVTLVDEATVWRDSFGGPHSTASAYCLVYERIDTKGRTPTAAEATLPSDLRAAVDAEIASFDRECSDWTKRYEEREAENLARRLDARQGEALEAVKMRRDIRDAAYFAHSLGVNDLRDGILRWRAMQTLELPDADSTLRNGSSVERVKSRFVEWQGVSAGKHTGGAGSEPTATLKSGDGGGGAIIADVDVAAKLDELGLQVKHDMFKQVLGLLAAALELVQGQEEEHDTIAPSGSSKTGSNALQDSSGTVWPNVAKFVLVALDVDVCRQHKRHELVSQLVKMGGVAVQSWTEHVLMTFPDRLATPELVASGGGGAEEKGRTGIFDGAQRVLVEAEPMSLLLTRLGQHSEVWDMFCQTLAHEWYSVLAQCERMLPEVLHLQLQGITAALQAVGTSASIGNDADDVRVSDRLHDRDLTQIRADGDAALERLISSAAGASRDNNKSVWDLAEAFNEKHGTLTSALMGDEGQ